jgi:hypothetical protein
MRIQGSASGPPARLSCHLSCNNGRHAPARAGTNCRQVQHWTLNLPERLRLHRQGRGARLITVITAAGIGFQLARTRTGDRAVERAIKRSDGATRYCPVCTLRPRHGRWNP